MCGINGFTFVDRDIAEEMNGLVAHRGPDSGGVWADGKVTLGEMIEYTRDQVKRFTGNQQHPDTAGLFDRDLPMGAAR